MMKSLIKYGSAIIFVLTPLLYAKSAFAQPPADIVGTWEGGTLGTTVITDVKVTVAAQYPENPEAVSECRFISGEMSVVTRVGPLDGSMKGFYCPNTGAFTYILYTTEDRETRQVYRGNISNNNGECMEGKFHYISGDWGEYDFSACKLPSS